MKTKIMFCSIIFLLFVFTGSVLGGTEGIYNTFYGTGAGTLTLGDNDNDTFIGAGAGNANTTGWGNVFLGYTAGYSNTTGNSNTILGNGAGYFNTTGTQNTFLGYGAGYANTTGNQNTFLGLYTGNANTTGNNNTFLGAGAGQSNSTGNNDTFLGYYAGFSNTTGANNTFVGYNAGYTNTTSTYNTFLGMNAGYTNTTGNDNTFVGYDAGYNTTAGYNTFIGRSAGNANSTGNYNTFVGTYAGNTNTTGTQNTFLGLEAGYLTTGSANVFLGYRAGYNETGSNKLYIANSSTSTPLIYGEFDTPKLTINGNFDVINPSGFNRFSDNLTDATQKVARITLNHYTNTEEPIYLFGGTSVSTSTYAHFGGGSTLGNAVTQMDFWTATNNTTLTGTSRLTIKGNGNVGIGTRNPSYALHMAGGAYSNGASWVSASSREYKDNIQSLKAKDAMETLQKLNPVTFSYKISPQENNVGFIAEDVPELIATKDRKGLSSMDIVAVLTKVVQEQQRTFMEYRKEQENTISILSEKVAELERALQAKGE